MKLYVLVRKDLTPSQQAVQAGHGVAEFLLTDQTTKWSNGTLVYLGVSNRQALEKWVCRLNSQQVEHVLFREPDIGNEITSIACCTGTTLFKKLPLLKL